MFNLIFKLTRWSNYYHRQAEHVFGGVCLSVRLFVCKITPKVMDRDINEIFRIYSHWCKKNRWLNFGLYPNHLF